MSAYCIQFPKGARPLPITPSKAYPSCGLKLSVLSGAIFETMVDTLENAMTDAKVARFFEDLGPEPEENNVA